jgi:hypothetical protein
MATRVTMSMHLWRTSYLLSILLHLGSIIWGLLTYPLLYHGYFMYCDLISRACKEIKTILQFLKAYARKIFLF